MGFTGLMPGEKFRECIQLQFSAYCIETILVSMLEASGKGLPHSQLRYRVLSPFT